jgi:hypothetical protein
MPYQTPITVKSALEKIFKHDYVLPAIQREFVWQPEQICRLFDSLMRGYPVGSFLFWHVNHESVKQFKFYGFVTDYHERNNPHCPPLDVSSDHAVVAILDGQQRLTALNIGLRGSHAKKEPRKWWDNPDAFPTKKLHLNVLGDAEEREDGLAYEFAFLTEERAAERDEHHFWYPVNKIREITSTAELYEYIHTNNLQNHKPAFLMLDKLFTTIHKDLVITFYEEDSQDIEKVLNIFIRTNSGGTVLSYSDLLLSIAVAQWEHLDARKEITALVDQLNETRNGFQLTKDFVLKAGLMLCDIASVGFKVENFNHANMAILEANWRRIEQALRLAIELVADFGFNGRMISADSAIHPISYYLYLRQLNSTYRTRQADKNDREAMRRFFVRSLLKPGVWGSGLDTTLNDLRDVIKNHGTEHFPVAELELALAKRGKSLRFEDAEIQDLADLTYADKRTFALLSLLYPFVDLRNEFHIDHVFPQSKFTRPQLKQAGFQTEEFDELQERVQRFGNLQLLEGALNQAKNDTLPKAWLNQRFQDDSAGRDAYTQRYDIPPLPDDLKGFDTFYNARRDMITTRLRALLIEAQPSQP